ISSLSTSSPFASRRTVIDSGRLPSWLLASSQVFVPSISISSGSCVFVTMNLLASSASTTTSLVKFGTSTSSTVYSISFLSSSTVGKSLNTCDQLLSSFNSLESITSSLANKFTVIDSGRKPATSSSSSHSLVTEISVNSGSSSSL